MKIKVAVVQDSPVFFDKEATFKKIETICINNASTLSYTYASLLSS